MVLTKTDLAEIGKLLDTRFIEERAYYRQLIKDELADIREKLERLDERTDEDSTVALKEITRLKTRLAKAEADIAKLKAA